MPLSSNYHHKPIKPSSSLELSDGTSSQQSISQILSAPLLENSHKTGIPNSQLLSLIIQYLSKFNNPQLEKIKDDLIAITGLNSVNTQLQSELRNLVFSPQLETNLDKLYSIINTISDKDTETGLQIQIAIQKRFFLESLFLDKNKAKSLRILRNLNEDFFQNNNDNQQLPKSLSYLLVDTSTVEDSNIPEIDEAFLKQLNWTPDSDFFTSRTALLSEIHSLLPADKIINPNRLPDLIEKSLLYQETTNPYYITPSPSLSTTTSQLSLFRNNNKQTTEKLKLNIPNKQKHRINDHNDQIWFLKYSNSGKYLASGSKDNSIIIYSTEYDYTVYKRLIGHSGSIIYLSWSSDDTRLISTSFDLSTKIWNLSTGELEIDLKNKDLFKSTIELRSFSVEFVGNDLNKFIVASPDCKIATVTISNEKDSGIEKVSEIGISKSIPDFIITNDGKYLCCITHNEDLYICDLTTPDNDLVSVTKIGRKLTSINKCNDTDYDSNYVLITVQPDHLQLWDISNPARPTLANKYYGLQQNTFIIRGCLTNNNLVISGSVDGYIYIWNKKFGNLIDVVHGHEKLVNCVDWRNKCEDGKLEWASCSDDNMLVVWGN